MPRHTKKDVSVNAMGKPTEATGVPQAPVRHRHSVMDGIVKGVARHTTTAVVDGILTGAPSKGAQQGEVLRKAPTIPVGRSATTVPEQGFGSVPYAMSKY